MCTSKIKTCSICILLLIPSYTYDYKFIKSQTLCLLKNLLPTQIGWKRSFISFFLKILHSPHVTTWKNLRSGIIYVSWCIFLKLTFFFTAVNFFCWHIIYFLTQNTTQIENIRWFYFHKLRKVTYFCFFEHVGEALTLFHVYA